MGKDLVDIDFEERCKKESWKTEFSWLYQHQHIVIFGALGFVVTIVLIIICIIVYKKRTKFKSEKKKLQNIPSRNSSLGSPCSDIFINIRKDQNNDVNCTL